MKIKTWIDAADDDDSREYFDEIQEYICNLFDSEIRPHVPSDDIPAMREAFNNWADSLCKDGEISDFVYDNVTHDGIE